MMIHFLKSSASLITTLSLSVASALYADTSKPNIVFIYADDMGYGDVTYLNPERCKIATPQLDSLAKQGMVFTDAHTSSSVCTPSRYSLMTGRYNWRTTLQYHVTHGYSTSLVADETLTVGEILQSKGYNTGMVGKWHLGMDFSTQNGKKQFGSGKNRISNINWQGAIAGGPVDHGFDYYYGIAASLDMPPYIYIENRHFEGIPTEVVTVKRHGDKHADFRDVDVLDKFVEKSKEFINQQSQDKPFFLYVPLTSPHTPIVPTPQWLGKSGINHYADFQMMTDDIIGQIVATLDEAGFKDNTLLIISSDNGCSKAANFRQLEAAGHFASAQFRGSKADLWEGGHRVPFIVRWPALIEAGSSSDETICLTDFLATCAEITGATVPQDQGVDSVSFLPALKGEEITSSRQGIVNHSISGHFAYRKGDWKLLLAKGSGGWSMPSERSMDAIEGSLEAQLYNLASDPGETTNLYAEKPEIAAELLAQLKKEVANGRSTAGPVVPNDIPIEDIKLWKGNVSR